MDGHRRQTRQLVLDLPRAPSGRRSVSQGSRVSAADEPETVVATFHAKAGAEAALARVIADHFSVARRLNLVLAQPHVTVRTSEGDKTAFIDIFTWKNGSVADDAPPAILAIWTEMAKLTEPRGGKAPGYRQRRDFGVGEAVPLILAGQEVAAIPVAELFPAGA